MPPTFGRLNFWFVYHRKFSLLYWKLQVATLACKALPAAFRSLPLADTFTLTTFKGRYRLRLVGRTSKSATSTAMATSAPGAAGFRSSPFKEISTPTPVGGVF